MDNTPIRGGRRQMPASFLLPTFYPVGFGFVDSDRAGPDIRDEGDRFVHSTTGARPAPTSVCLIRKFVTPASNTAELMWVTDKTKDVSKALKGLSPEPRT